MKNEKNSIFSTYFQIHPWYYVHKVEMCCTNLSSKWICRKIERLLKGKKVKWQFSPFPTLLPTHICTNVNLNRPFSICKCSYAKRAKAAIFSVYKEVVFRHFDFGYPEPMHCLWIGNVFFQVKEAVKYWLASVYAGDIWGFCQFQISQNYYF